MFLRFKIILLSFIILFCSISYAIAKKVPEEKKFSLPELPDTLKTPKDRANYLVLHYWDHFNFTTTPAELKAFEQIFVDFVYILPHADKESAVNAIINLISCAEKEQTGKMTTVCLELAEKYLYEIQSPFHQEEYYIPILQYLLSKDNSVEQPDEKKAGLQNKIERLFKNRQGELATDFPITLASGEESSLYQQKGDSILLLFFDPDCHNCMETIRLLKTHPPLLSLVREGKVKILAVYPGENSQTWKNYQQQLPENWISGCNSDLSVREKELYELRILPTLYLLDKNKKVVLKNITPSRLESYFQ